MPSVSRLVPALILALTGYFAADIYVTYLPEGTNVGTFRRVIAILGLLIGWIVVGKRIGRSYRSGVEAGLLGAFLIVFWAVGIFAVREMLARSLDRRYRQGLEQAFRDLFDLLVEYGLSAARVELIVTLITGAVISGLVAQWASTRWK